MNEYPRQTCLPPDFSGTLDPEGAARWECATVPITPELMRQGADAPLYSGLWGPVRHGDRTQIALHDSHREKGLSQVVGLQMDRQGRWFIIRRGVRRYLAGAEVYFCDGRPAGVRFLLEAGSHE